MFTLIVDGLAVFKLAGMSEIPDSRGKEAWQVVDEEGNTIAAYQPKRLGGASTSKKRAPKPAYDHVRA